MKGGVKNTMKNVMKKGRAKEPGLFSFWPREADTITFQEG